LEAFRDRARTNQALEAKGWPVVVSPVPLNNIVLSGDHRSQS
jgi:hypothetical protein